MLTISDVVDLSRFRFDLTYRVVRSDTGNLSPSASAVAVSGVENNGSGILWYGDPVPGTLCSRNLHSCDQRTCILQSPNFPGLYPRYITSILSFFLVFFLFRSFESKVLSDGYLTSLKVVWTVIGAITPSDG